ncbi:phosphatidylserine decarboxylase [Sphingomonas sp.]|uniref:phosphatidylserine decarboxylase n=1 Tax=Sphingomonas sp. TaxID=28214 RepID=UPI00286D0075|nr:phosphatidylserine decarboxylase [Sphingomonas sp.]
MPEIDKPDSQLTAVKWRFPSVHPEGRKFALIAAVATLIAYNAISPFLGWLMVGLTIWVAAFFRDPIRTTPQDPSLIVAPADGLITMVVRVAAPPELAGQMSGTFTRVSMFMSVFDVHINRAPIAGRIARVAYVPGKFLNADLDKASEDNERQHFLVTRDDGVSIGFTQIAGLVARRIMAFVKEGDTVAAGERIGLIRFGSRVDVYLPEGTSPQVVLGQRTIAGETVLATIGQTRLLIGSSQ